MTARMRCGLSSFRSWIRRWRFTNFLSGIMPTSVLVLEYGLLITLLAGGYILKWFTGKDRKIPGPHRHGLKYFLEKDS